MLRQARIASKPGHWLVHWSCVMRVNINIKYEIFIKTSHHHIHMICLKLAHGPKSAAAVACSTCECLQHGHEAASCWILFFTARDGKKKTFVRSCCMFVQRIVGAASSSPGPLALLVLQPLRQAPIDFLMRGRLANGQDVGLATIPGYSVRVVLLRSLEWQIIWQSMF